MLLLLFMINIQWNIFQLWVCYDDLAGLQLRWSSCWYIIKVVQLWRYFGIFGYQTFNQMQYNLLFVLKLGLQCFIQFSVFFPSNIRSGPIQFIDDEWTKERGTLQCKVKVKAVISITQDFASVSQYLWKHLKITYIWQ